MRLARIALFLLLCLPVAAAQTPEQEMEVEAQKLLPKLFSKCGEDYYSKRAFRYGSGTAWIIGHYKGVTAKIQKETLTSRDASLGIEWKGNIRFQASSAREYPHGMKFPERGPNAQNRNDAWSGPKPPNLAGYFFLVTKKNGVITLKRRTEMELTPVACADVPK